MPAHLLRMPGLVVLVALVYVATGCAPQFALWGGLMTTRAQHLKAAGAVLELATVPSGSFR